MVECNTSLGLAVGGREDGSFKIKEEKTPPETARLLSEIDSGEGVLKAKAGTRKKLKLSQLQRASLEDAFRAHTALAPEQKQGLAQRLDLRPRQVEVWFQNRRARTKLKQTELAYEFLKECCERLTTENTGLQRELMELKLTTKPHQPPSPCNYAVLLRPEAAKLSMCSSCGKMTVSCESNSSSN